MSHPSARSLSSLFALTLCAGGVGGCGDSPTDVAPPPGLTVTSIDPTSAYPDVTVDVHVLGSGFGQGARAVWSRGSDTAFATTRVRINGTTVVSAGELLANITIQADAQFGAYTVMAVAADGRTATAASSFAVNPRITRVPRRR